ncbi:MAG: shikimate kinase [Bryobacteraceae bacterium]
MIFRLKQTPGIYIVGFMGSGKTTVGRLLAGRLGWHFSDIDDDIEERAKRTIPEIFDELGEAEFRRIESEAVAERVQAISLGRPTVVSLGGGAFAQQVNFDIVSTHGVSIWLDCPLWLARKRVERFTHRPLARDPAKFAALYEARLAVYARADYRIPIECDDPEKAVAAILALGLW